MDVFPAHVLYGSATTEIEDEGMRCQMDDRATVLSR